MARILTNSFASAHTAAPIETDYSAAVVQLQRKVDNLEAALASQRAIGTVIGILAQRYGCTTDEAWTVLARLSQATQIKVRDVARVLQDAFNGRVREEDAVLLAAVAGRLPGGFDRTADSDPGPTAL